jgi:2-polyprenyl-3-methyl-5-hydroxy-6-metoxy-1,4-benzoquinol methylase
VFWRWPGLLSASDAGGVALAGGEHVKRTSFDRYDVEGAYHWAECDKASPGNVYNPALEARYRVIAQRVVDGGVALDVGCGDGYLMGQISRRCQRVTGIDQERTAVDLANKMLAAFPNCRAQQGSCCDLPFPNERFDTVVMADVIEHLEAPELAVKELARVLKPTGTVYLTTPMASTHRPLGEYHVQEFTPGQFEELLRRDFEAVAVSYYWPIRWFRLYETRVGWRLLKTMARHWYNPFAVEGSDARNFDQMLAVCQGPRSAG